MSISYLMRTTHGRFHVNRPMWFASFRYCIGFRLTTMTFSIFDRAHVCIHEHKSKKNPSWLLHTPKICDSEYPSQELNLRLTFYKNVALTTELEGWKYWNHITLYTEDVHIMLHENNLRAASCWQIPRSRSKCEYGSLPISLTFVGLDWRKLIFLFTKFFLQVWRVCFAGVA